MIINFCRKQHFYWSCDGSMLSERKKCYFYKKGSYSEECRFYREAIEMCDLKDAQKGIQVEIDENIFN